MTRRRANSVRHRYLPLLLLIAGLMIVGTTLPAVGQDAPDYETTTGVTEPGYEQQVTEEYRVETEHGTMYGWVTRPDPDAYPELYAQGQGSEGPGVPVVLVLSPYNSLYQPVAGAEHVLTRWSQDYLPQRGYAFAQFDVVGTRESGGCYDYGGIRERETGAAVVDFLGAQDWSNGNVGMIGGSYDGTTALAAAVEQPEHLTAIIPQVAIDRWYDYAFGAGVRYFLNSEEPSDEGFDTPFAFDFGFALIPPTAADEPQGSGEVLAERINPCDRLQHEERAYVPDPVYDDFWVERDYRHLADRVEAAVFLEGGWLDHNVKHWDTTGLWSALPDDHPKKLAIGQWPHSASQFEDAEDLRHAWFDHWLLGLDTGVMDLPRVDTQTSTGERLQQSDWPPAGTERLQVSLVDREGDETRPGELTLGTQFDDAAYTDSNVALDEEQMFGGACAPQDTCLLFTTPPLDADVRISGAPLLQLRATSDAAATHYTPVLFHVGPDGEEPQVITRGFLNARNRDGLDTSEPLTPDEAYDAPIPVWDTDYVVPAGRRLGVVVASSNAAWALPDDDARATNTIDVGGASYLELPVSTGAGALQAPDDTDTGDDTGAPPGAGETTADTAGDGEGSPSDDAGSLPATGGSGALLAAGLLALAGIGALRRR